MNKKVVSSIIIILTLVYGLRFVEAPTPRVDVVPEKQLSCRYYDKARFEISLKEGLINQDIKNRDKLSDKIQGGIVPHHLLADRMIADFFYVVSKANPEIVFVIGPNHKGEGVQPIHTASWDWNTPYGVLESDEEIVKELQKTPKVSEDFELMEREHSISCLVPYIKYFMPQVKIVPLLLTSTDSIGGNVELGKTLVKMAGNKRCLFIASVDFSHYLSPEESDKKDEITKKILLERNIQGIRSMDNDYLDSPASIITLLSAMETLGASHQQILEHNNSARISGKNSDSTTSYFTWIYW